MRPIDFRASPHAETDGGAWWFAHAVNHDRAAFDRKLAEETERIRNLSDKAGTVPHPATAHSGGGKPR